MNPGRYNITVYNGTTFSLAPSWLINNLAVNLTGYSATMQVRDVSNNLIVEMSTANGRAVITPQTGTVTFTLSATETSAANLPAGNYTYDLNLTAPDATVYKILQGVFIVNPSVVQ